MSSANCSPPKHTGGLAGYENCSRYSIPRSLKSKAAMALRQNTLVQTRTIVGIVHPFDLLKPCIGVRTIWPSCHRHVISPPGLRAMHVYRDNGAHQSGRCFRFSEMVEFMTLNFGASQSDATLSRPRILPFRGMTRRSQFHGGASLFGLYNRWISVGRRYQVNLVSAYAG